MAHIFVMKSPEALLAERLSRFPEVDRIILFGSRARGDCAPRADIDLAVDCPRADVKGWLDMIEAAEEVPTLLKIDLVRLDTAPDDLAAAIRTEGRILYDRRKSKAPA